MAEVMTEVTYRWLGCKRGYNYLHDQEAFFNYLEGKMIMCVRDVINQYKWIE